LHSFGRRLTRLVRSKNADLNGSYRECRKPVWVDHGQSRELFAWDVTEKSTNGLPDQLHLHNTYDLPATIALSSRGRGSHRPEKKIGRTGAFTSQAAQMPRNRILPKSVRRCRTRWMGTCPILLSNRRWDHSSTRTMASPMLMRPRASTFAVMPPKPRVAL
jgi:hypothetical protein